MNPASQVISTVPAVVAGRDVQLSGRAGIDLAPESWPSVAELKSIEAAGFRWLQVYSPPLEMLVGPRYAVRHAKALSELLADSPLRLVVHAPHDLQLGDSLHDRAFEGLIEYTHQVGAGFVVYHALDFPRRGRQSAAEELSLRRMVDWAEILDIRIAVENLCPTYPGPANVCHDPLAVRDLIKRVDSPALTMVFDLGHANIVADVMGVEPVTLLEPVAETVGLFHMHDNFGARKTVRPARAIDVDPLRTDLHLVPGQGTVNWTSLKSFLREHRAPVLMEIDPQRRAPVNELYDEMIAALGEVPGANVAGSHRRDPAAGRNRSRGGDSLTELQT